MNRINAGRVIPGGAAGAAIVFIVAGLLPGITLDSDLKVWHQSTNNLYTHPSRSVATVLFALMSLVFGLTGTWIYAGIRPRYGPGPQTAVLAGVLVCVSGWLTAPLGRMALRTRLNRFVTNVTNSCSPSSIRFRLPVLLRMASCARLSVERFLSNKVTRTYLSLSFAQAKWKSFAPRQQGKRPLPSIHQVDSLVTWACSRAAGA